MPLRSLFRRSDPAFHQPPAPRKDPALGYGDAEFTAREQPGVPHPAYPDLQRRSRPAQRHATTPRERGQTISGALQIIRQREALQTLARLAAQSPSRPPSY